MCDNGPKSPEEAVRSFGHPQDSNTTIQTLVIADFFVATRGFYVSASGMRFLKPDC